MTIMRKRALSGAGRGTVIGQTQDESSMEASTLHRGSSASNLTSNKEGDNNGSEEGGSGGRGTKDCVQDESSEHAQAVSSLGNGCVPSCLRGSIAQNVIVGIVCFCCPGIFNALQGLGNAGGSDPEVASTMNAVLYACFAIFGYFGGFLFNVFGPKILLSVGGITYCGYALGVYLWGAFDLSWLAIMLSASLGIGAGMLWTAQGAIVMAYPTEKQKGRFFATFWIIFNLGGTVGGLLSFALEYNNSDSADSVSPASYFAFVAIMAFGSVLALLFVVSPSTVIRSDGKAVEFETAKSPKAEFISVAKMFMHPVMLLLTPLILCSNWMYTYEFNGVNGQLFNSRTRGLNSALFWGMQMFGAYVAGNFLDSKRMRRRTRAILGLCLAGGFNLAQWGYALYIQFGWTGPFTDYVNPSEPFSIWDKDNKVCALPGAPLTPQPSNATLGCTESNACFNGTFYEAPACPPEGYVSGDGQLIDFLDGSAWAVPGTLFLLMGLADALVQTYAYWIMGACANDATTLARFAGYYKGVQSVGVAIAWGLDAAGILYRWQLVICVFWAVVMLPFTFVLASRVRNTSTSGDIPPPSTREDGYYDSGDEDAVKAAAAALREKANAHRREPSTSIPALSARAAPKMARVQTKSDVMV